MTALQLQPAPVVRQKAFSIDELGLCNPDEQGALKYITRVVRRIFSAKMALIGVFEQQVERQILVSGLGMPTEWEQAGWIPLTKSFSQFVHRDAVPLAVNDKDTHPLGGELAELDQLPFRSYLGAPIFGPTGAALGALCVVDPKVRHWSEEDIAVMQDLAHCATDAILLRAALITSRQLQNDLERALNRSRRNAAIRDTIIAAFTEPDKSAEQRLQAMLAAGCRALKMRAAGVTRVDGSRTLVIARFCSTDQDMPPGNPDNSASLTAHLMSGQEIVWFANPQTAGLAGKCAFDGSTPRKFVGTPLILDGIAYGTLEFVGDGPNCIDDMESDTLLVSVIAMFTITQLEIFSQIDRLKRSEAALLQYILDLRAAQ
ncbi:GAF domain-containing protein [Aliiruegeria lutimaris]|uniref:GAF domain-containing protein n=1 Tax=Aliiruegeria lutimaris TaxID=571298 RepID=A0A1G9BYJ5_9RHOB|nr:GAF domain-containing protein [Aliiruegeria lutimaris]SDK44244.1 GAF domain-containing protein [Aliiruegeria lutimaris]